MRAAFRKQDDVYLRDVSFSSLKPGAIRLRIRESAEYGLKQGSPGGGYVFSSSNTIFPGVPLKNYELMLDVSREFCRSEL